MNAPRILIALLVCGCAETRAAILAVYPEDKATGCRIGDLRGIWRVKMPAAAAP